jgi:protein-disulfide isomerase
MENTENNDSVLKTVETKNMLANMSQMQTFIFGLVEGVLVLCTIGFFIMLGIYFKSDSSNNTPSIAAKAPTTAPGAPTAAPTAPEDPKNVTVAPIDEKIDHIRGNKNAKVTLLEYSDLECPFCKRFHPTIQQVATKYGDKVRWVYRHFPLDSIHQKARPEAVASECAGEQGKFWEFIDHIYEITPGNDRLDHTKLGQYAKEAGVSNIAKFEKCVADNKYADRVQRDTLSGEAAQVNGTPATIVIGPDGSNVLISGARPAASFEAVIDGYLK